MIIAPTGKTKMKKNRKKVAENNASIVYLSHLRKVIKPAFFPKGFPKNLVT